MKTFQETYSLICEMLCDAKDLEIGDISPEMTLVQLKLDSLDYVELMVLAKREFGVTLTAAAFIEKPQMTLSELCTLVLEQSEKR